MCQKRVLIYFASELLTLVSSILLIVSMDNLTNGQLGNLRQEGLSFLWETNFDLAVFINFHSLLFECFFVGFWIWLTFSTTIMGLDFLYHTILLLDFTFEMITTQKVNISNILFCIKGASKATRILG